MTPDPLEILERLHARRHALHASKYAEVKTMNKDQIIEQAKDKLKDPKKHSGCSCYICNLWREEREEILSLLESVKAEPPEPVRQDDGGEFVKALRGFSDAIRNLPQYRGTTICSKFDEACDCLDAQAKEIAELKVALEEMLAFNNEAAAENAKLKEHGIITANALVKRIKENKALAERVEKFQKDWIKIVSSEGRHCTQEWWIRRVDKLVNHFLEQALQEGEKPCTQPNNLVGNKEQ